MTSHSPSFVLDSIGGLQQPFYSFVTITKKAGKRAFFVIITGGSTGDFKKHYELMKEKQAAARQALGNKQHSVVGDLAIKAVEQAIEADAARNKIPKHFGEHEGRLKYLKSLSEELYQKARKLWFIYGDLGYDGVDGERARRAMGYVDAIIKFFEERWK